MRRSLEENPSLYAKLIVGEGLALAPGQELLVFAEIDQAPFVRLVVAEAYRAGAKNVEVLWSDPQTVLTRYREGSDEAIAGCASAERSIAERQRDSRLAILNPTRIAAAPAPSTASPADDPSPAEASTGNEKCKKHDGHHRDKDCPRDHDNHGKKDDDDKPHY